MKKVALLCLSLGWMVSAYAIDDLVSENDAQILLANQKLVQAHYEMVDVSMIDPK